MRLVRGFTLIELMVVVVIVAILAAIAFPSYSAFIRKNDLAVAKQEALRISAELEKFKAKNFSYKGFNVGSFYSTYNAANNILRLPLGSNATNAKYELTLVDLATKDPLGRLVDDKGAETTASQAVKGLEWGIKVERVRDNSGTAIKDPKNYDLLLTSTGIRCMTKTKDSVDAYTGCGSTDSENW